ncbi:MAG TPA: hypothetical protein H9881_09775 [Candidatus Stackebrandtia excrementipullorum]|nr:hypothetical protein [Candidatus Stackebrandtia excrementipullorum]
MTQPPPYQGGYPAQEPPQQPGYGQQPPPSQPVPGQPQPPAQGNVPPPPGYGQQPPPSGFPPPGAPGTPPPSGFGQTAKNAGKGLALRLALIVGILALLGGGAWVFNVLSGDTSVSGVGDCTNKSANRDDDASDIKTVDCESPDAYFTIVAREDDPSSNDHEAVAEQACAGTDAAEYVYSERGTQLEWIICLDPINIDTPKWGELPQPGDCLSDSGEYPMQLFDCGDPSATDEIVTVAEELSGLVATQEALDQEALKACGETGWEYYYSNLQNFGEELEWILCTKTPGA